MKNGQCSFSDGKYTALFNISMTANAAGEIQSLNTIPTNSQTPYDTDSLCLTDRNTSEPDGFLSVSNTAADCWISYT